MRVRIRDNNSKILMISTILFRSYFYKLVKKMFRLRFVFFCFFLVLNVVVFMHTMLFLHYSFVCMDRFIHGSVENELVAEKQWPRNVHCGDQKHKRLITPDSVQVHLKIKKKPTVLFVN